MNPKIKLIAKNILNQCMGLNKSENLLIVTDNILKDVGKIFLESGNSITENSKLISIKPMEEHGEEPPSEVEKALLHSDVALLITSKSLSHTNARKQACNGGTRIASMPGINLDIVKRSLNIEYNKLDRELSKYSKKFNSANNLKIKSKNGTKLSMSIKKREAFIDNGLYLEKGDFGNLPAGEICLAPKEGTTGGTLVIDGSFPEMGKLSEPIKVQIREGKVENVNNDKIKKRLKKYGKKAYNIAEVGVGFNPKAVVSGNVLEDEKVFGTAHIAFGDNRSFGGYIEVPCHLDAVFLNPKIFLDNKLLTIN